MTPSWLEDVFEIRRRIGDPITGDLVYVDDFPEEPLENTAYTTGDERYWYFNQLGKQQYKIKHNDSYIRAMVEGLGRVKASIKLIDLLIAKIDPTDYITSGNAGGQSVSFLSLTDILAYYNALKDVLLEEEADAEGLNSGVMLSVVKRPVGGVQEVP